MQKDSVNLDEPASCPRPECEGEPLDNGECHVCGFAATLASVPDYETGKLFDEWFLSVSYTEMQTLMEKGVVQLEFDKWCSQRAVKH